MSTGQTHTGWLASNQQYNRHCWQLLQAPLADPMKGYKFNFICCFSDCQTSFNRKGNDPIFFHCISFVIVYMPLLPVQELIGGFKFF